MFITVARAEYKGGLMENYTTSFEDELLQDIKQHFMYEIRDTVKEKLEKELDEEIKKKYLQDYEDNFINNFVANHQQEFYDLLFKEDDEKSCSDEEMQKDEEVSIKDFLYLDITLMKSFIAQIKDGELLTEIHDNLTSEKKSRIDANRKRTVKKALNIKAFGFNSENEITTPSFNSEFIDVGREISIKEHTDNVFNALDAYLAENNLVNNYANIEVGQYIKLDMEFEYFNFDRIESLFEQEFLDRLYLELAEENKNNKMDLMEIHSKLPMLKKLIPYNSFLYGKDMLILLTDDCIRGDAKKLGFIFDKNVKVLGKVNKHITNQKNDENSSRIVNSLNSMQNYSLNILKKLGFINTDEVYLITPIAIYYEYK